MALSLRSRSPARCGLDCVKLSSTIPAFVGAQNPTKHTKTSESRVQAPRVSKRNKTSMEEIFVCVCVQCMCVVNVEAM